LSLSLSLLFYFNYSLLLFTLYSAFVILWMPERCYHDQDLLRNASPPSPSRSLDRTHPSPTASSSRTHRHTHSAAHHQHRHRRQVSTDGSQSQKRSAGYLGRNEGGWLACSPLEELPSAHRNEPQQDSLCSSNTTSPMAGNGKCGLVIAPQVLYELTCPHQFFRLCKRHAWCDLQRRHSETHPAHQQTTGGLKKAQSYSER
jgi:hypothetical protein